MDSFEAWNEFRRGEIVRPVKLVCCDCGGPAEGNVTCEIDGVQHHVCNACHEAAVGEVEYPNKLIYDDIDESMDGDFDSGMASAGLGTDEDYGYYGGGDDF